MKLIKENEIYIADCSFEEKDIPKSAGFRWNPDERCWWTDSLDKASRLVEFADDSIKEELGHALEEREESLQDSSATDADIKIPSPEGLEYLPFQKAGIKYALGRVNTLIGDEMGLGKTIQAIGLMNAVSDLRRVLVVCPASLRLNWKLEIEKWLVHDLTIGVAQGKDLPDADIVIINYDIMHRHHAELLNVEWDLMVVDEVHYCKSPKARRTKYTLGFKKSRRVNGRWTEVVEVAPFRAKRKVFLTGTPIANRPVELWPIANCLDPRQFKNFFYFAKRYCAAFKSQWGWDCTGSSNLSELQEKLRRGFMVRRLKKDVLSDLPSKRRQVIELPVNGCAALVKKERKVWDKWEEEIEGLKAAVELSKVSDNPADYENAVSALNGAIQVAFNEMSKVRHDTAVAKVPTVVEHLLNVLEANGKVVVMAHHHDVVDGLKKGLADKKIKSVSLTGKDKLESRQEAVEAFQNDDEVRVFIGSIKAAGVGITLTASSHVVFAELDWVPANLSQAEDRCHRIGQRNSVLVQHLVLQGSLDATMAHKLVGKQRVIDAALDDEILEYKVPVIPSVDVEEQTREEIANVAENLRDPEIQAIHEGLRMLAGKCDGAVALDGMGFNGFDARIGHSLADSRNLSPKQAALGKRLVNKYRRQLPSELLEVLGIE